MISLIKCRHDEAVLHTLFALLEGVHKDCTITCDARSVSEASRLVGVERDTKLPAWVLPRDHHHSYPDICLINGTHLWVRIIELKYATGP